MRLRIVLLLILSTLILAGCFRDAGEDREASSVNVQEVLTSMPTIQASATVAVTPSPTTINVATLTPGPTSEPTDTLAPGGPPIATSTAQSESTATRQSPQTVPSFTPAGEQFGDPGILPTSDIPTQNAPSALITPTGLPTQEIDECIHIVQANDTLTQIALLHDVTVDEMVAANPELNGNAEALLAIGQELQIAGCISTTAAETAEPVDPETVSTTPTVASPPGTITYTVQSGDNLFRIALNNNTTVDAIIAANPELGGGSTIYPGQVLIIPVGE